MAHYALSQFKLLSLPFIEIESVQPKLAVMTQVLSSTDMANVGGSLLNQGRFCEEG